MGANDDSVVSMFDAVLLKELDVGQYGISISKDDSSSYLRPDEGLVLRPLSTEDFQKGLLALNSIVIFSPKTKYFILLIYMGHA